MEDFSKEQRRTNEHLKSIDHYIGEYDHVLQ